mgnify:CR=1 FL=1|jgi:type IV pilus assembly protein PilV
MNTVRTQEIKGVALIEILISLLILSVGVIGLSNVQINAKRVAQEALQRTKASSLASDMLERIRANPKGFAAYNGAEVGRSSITAEPADCRLMACTPTDVAARDLWEWQRALDGADETRVADEVTRQVGGLYLPYGCVVTDLGGQAGRVQVTVAWEGFRDLGYAGANACGAVLGLKRQLLSFESFVAGTRQ